MKKVDNRVRDFILLIAFGLLLLAPTIVSSVQAKTGFAKESAAALSTAVLWKKSGPEIVGAIAMMVAGVAVIIRKKD